MKCPGTPACFSLLEQDHHGNAQQAQQRQQPKRFDIGKKVGLLLHRPVKQPIGLLLSADGIAGQGEHGRRLLQVLLKFWSERTEISDHQGLMDLRSPGDQGGCQRDAYASADVAPG